MTQQVQNILAKRIDTAGAMISYDDACKRVLSNKTVLAWIMKTCIPEYQLMDIDEIAEKYIEGEPEISGSAVHMDETKEFIHGMHNESPSIKEGTVTFDIKFRAIIPDLTESIDMIINIEAQNDFYPGYPIVKRGVYYACRLISDQYGTVFDRSEYQKIRKVASIWICPNPPEYRANTISGYSLTEKISWATQEKIAVTMI